MFAKFGRACIPAQASCPKSDPKRGPCPTPWLTHHLHFFCVALDAPQRCISRHVGSARTQRVKSHDTQVRAYGRFKATVQQQQNLIRAAARLESIKAALSVRGQSLPENCILERPINHLEGPHRIRHLLAQPDTLTAIICGSDVYVIGALLECKRLNVSDPDQLSIVSFDNSELAPLMDPPLTKVDLAVQKVGSCAAVYLLNAMDGKDAPSQIVLEHQLVIRESAAFAPSGNYPDSIGHAQFRLPLEILLTIL